MANDYITNNSDCTQSTLNPDNATAEMPHENLQASVDMQFQIKDAEQYSISLHTISPVSEERLTELTTAAIRLAERHAGVFERVDTEFVPTRR